MQPLTQDDDYSFLKFSPIKSDISSSTQESPNLEVSDQDDDYSFLKKISNPQPAAKTNTKTSTLNPGSIVRGLYNVASGPLELLELANKLAVSRSLAVGKPFWSKELSKEDKEELSAFDTPTLTSRATQFLEDKELLSKSALGENVDGFLEAAVQGGSFGALAGPAGAAVGAGLGVVGEGVSQVTGSPLTGMAAELMLGIAPGVAKSGIKSYKHAKNKKRLELLKAEMAPLKEQQKVNEFKETMSGLFNKFQNSDAHLSKKSINEFSTFTAQSLLPNEKSIYQPLFDKIAPVENRAAFGAQVQESVNRKFTKEKKALSRKYEKITNAVGDIQVSPEQMEKGEREILNLTKGTRTSLISTPEESGAAKSVNKIGKALRTRKPQKGGLYDRFKQLKDNDLDTFTTKFFEEVGDSGAFTEELVEDIYDFLNGTVSRGKKVTFDNLFKTNIALGSMVNYDTIDVSIKNRLLKPAKRIVENMIYNGLVEAGHVDQARAFKAAQRKFATMTDDYRNLYIRGFRKSESPSQEIPKVKTPENIARLRKVTDKSLHPGLELEYVKNTAPHIEKSSADYKTAKSEAKEFLSPESYGVWEEIVEKNSDYTVKQAQQKDLINSAIEVVDGIATNTPPQNTLNKMKNPEQFQRLKLHFNTTGKKNSSLWKTLEKQFFDQTMASMQTDGAIDVKKLRNVVNDPGLMEVLEKIVGKKAVGNLRDIESISQNITKAMGNKETAEAALKEILKKKADSRGPLSDFVISLLASVVKPGSIPAYFTSKKTLQWLQAASKDSNIQAALKALANPKLTPKNAVKIMNSMIAAEQRLENQKDKD